MYPWATLPEGWADAKEGVEARAPRSRRAAGTRPFVYISDVKAVPEATDKWLRQRPIGILVVDLLRRADHTTHFSYDEAVAFVRSLRPAHRSLLTTTH